MSITADIGVLAEVESKSSNKKLNLKSDQTIKDEIIETQIYSIDQGVWQDMPQSLKYPSPSPDINFIPIEKKVLKQK